MNRLPFCVLLKTIVWVLSLTLLACFRECVVTASREAVLNHVDLNQPWYVGCFAVPDTIFIAGSLDVGSLSNSVECSLACARIKFSYAIVQSHSECSCSNTVNSLNSSTHLATDHCDNSCSLTNGDGDSANISDDPVDKSLSLPCGGSHITAAGTRVVSVYRSNGPILANVSLSVVQTTVYVGQPFDLLAVVIYAGGPNTPIGVSFSDDRQVFTAKVSFVWQLNEGLKTDTVVAQSRYVKSLMTSEFSSEGTYFLNFTASNTLSFVQSTLAVTVVRPVPLGVTIAIITEPENLPRCRPLGVETGQVVYGGVSVTLEALTALSANLTFEWTLRNEDEGYIVDVSTMHGISCLHGQTCTTSSKEYVLGSSGSYSARVVVSNEFGSTTETFHMVAIHRALMDLELVPETLFAAADDDVTLSISMTLTFVTNVTLFVDFKDGTNRSFTLDEHRVFRALLQSDREHVAPDSIAFKGNYGSSCKLIAEIKHHFNVEGTYCIVLSVTDGSYVDAVSLQNETCVTVEYVLSTVSLVVPSLVVAGQNVSIHAALPVDTSRVSYHWNVSCCGRSDPDMVVSFPTGFDDSVSTVVFRKPGFCRVGVTVANFVSSITNQTDVMVVVPISGLNLVCHGIDHAGLYFDADFPVRCTAQTESGSDVHYVWKFDNGSPDEEITDGSSVSRATGSFPTVGGHNVSVVAKNIYNLMSSALQVNVVVAIKSVSVLAETGRVGEPTKVSVCCEYGSNLTFVFDFGDGSRHAELQSPSTVGVSYHSYMAKGVYNGSVKVYNAISNESISFVVEVLANISSVEIAVVSPALIIGRNLVFSAIVDGGLTMNYEVVYDWFVDGKKRSVSAIPVFDWVFAETRIYDVCVSVSNLVSSRSSCRQMDILHADLQLAFNSSIAFAFPDVYLSLLNLPVGEKELLISHGDGLPNETVNTSDNSYQWHYQYSKRGLYEVQVECRQSGSVILNSTRTFVSPVDPITIISIIGPSDMAVINVCTSGSWSALVAAGSHPAYVWNVGNETTTTGKSMLTKALSFGQHVVNVTAVNGLSSMSSDMLISVHHNIRVVNSSVKPVVQGNPSQFEFTFSGSREFEIALNYNDGVSENFVTDFNATFLTLLSPPDDDAPPVYRMLFSHTYANMGRYLVAVTIGNKLSRETVRLTAAVGEEFSDISLTTNSTSSLISLGSVVIATAEVGSGRDVVFSWLPDSCVTYVFVNSSGTQSVAVIRFKMLGLCQIQVLVTSLFVPAPKSALIAFTIADRIDSVELAYTPGGPVQLDFTDGVWSTGVIQFEASVALGSNVTFSFTFGDDSPTYEIPGTLNAHRSVASVGHVFGAEGCFLVVVTARNVLGNASASLNCTVQKAVAGLTLNGIGRMNIQFDVKLGNSISFLANVTQGSSVRYNWEFSNLESLIDAGPNVTHRYSSVGVYELTVYAYNELSYSERIVSKVIVQEALLSVELVPDVTVQRLGRNVRFDVRTHPPFRFNIKSCVFKFGTYSKSVASCSLTHNFKTFGKHMVSVTAINFVNTVSSQQIPIDIIEDISDISILLNNSASRRRVWALVNSESRFSIYHFAGNNVTLNWNISDGTVLKTRDVEIKHVFKSLGVFNVFVNASNIYNWKASTVTVFVLNRPCNPPTIAMNAWAMSFTNRYNRSESIRFEADVGINCSITQAATYVWRLQNASGSSVSLIGYAYHNPVLILPPRFLTYGDYVMELEIVMNGTIVFGRDSVYFSVVPSSLVAIVDGGVQRYTSRSSADNLIIDGSQSFDPDSPNVGNLRFYWKCYDFDRPSKPCFIDATTTDVPAAFHTSLSDDGSVIRFNMTSLRSDIKDFLFNLTVSRIDRPNETAVAAQLLSISEDPYNIECPKCRTKLVEIDEQLVFQAVHDGFSEKVLVYSWQLYRIAGGSASQIHDNCWPNFDGQMYSMVWNSSAVSTNDTSMGISMSTDTSNSPSSEGDLTTHEDQVTELRTETTSTTYQPTTMSTTTKVSKGRSAGRRSPPLHMNIEEGLSGSQGRPPAAAADLASSTVPPPVSIASGGGGGHFMFDMDSIAEGEGNPAGNRGPIEQGDVSVLRPATKNPLIDESRSDTIDNSILRRQRIKNENFQSLTATGTSSRLLVINGGTLVPGNVYIIQLTVAHKDTQLQGSALTYFEVGHGPNLGRCTFKPTGGIEMSTEFSVYCQQWKDPNLPLQYEISYSLADTEPRHLIYYGLKSTVVFKLPAGSPSTNYTVQVHTAIVNSRGARTVSCTVSARVLPSEMSDNYLYDFILGNITTMFPPSPFQVLLQKGFVDQVRRFTLSASRLFNRREIANTSTSLRAYARHQLLQALKLSPYRDVLEVQQMLSAIQSITANKFELHSMTCLLGGTLVQEVVPSVVEILGDGSYDWHGLVPLSLGGISNIIDCLLTQTVTGARIAMLSDNLLDLVEQLLKIQMVPAVVDKAVKDLSTTVLTTHTARRSTNVTSIWADSVVVNLPEDIVDIITRSYSNPSQNSIDFGSDCYETAVSVYKRNPYLVSSPLTSMVQTNVVALNLYSCQGKPIIVQNLTSNAIEILIPHDQSVNGGVSEYILDRTNMNIHKYNVTAALLQLPLHVEISVSYMNATSRVFPITLFFRADSPPTITDYSKSWKFNGKVQSISLSIPSDMFQDSETFYLAIAYGLYDSMRPRPGQLQACNYTIRVWSGECVYWDTITRTWSNRGCVLHNSSTYTMASCRCTHLTSFAVRMSQTQGTFFSVAIASFFPGSLNCAVPTTIATLFVLYAVFIVISRKLDVRDDRKSDIVRLVDNNPYDQQKYYISLETGFRKGAGTTAKVSIVLHGEYGMSETRELVSHSGQPLFERNSRDTFYMTFPESLGRIFKVQLWHNNSGSSPSWYLSRVVVKDACTGENYYFVFEKWFGVEKEDGKLEREVMAADGGLGFMKVLKAKGTQYLTDYHLWFSMFVKPSYSRFSRAQRTTCCLGLITSTMALNAIWLNYHNVEYQGEFTMIDISWPAIVVGMVTSLIALVPNVVIALVFRRSVLTYGISTRAVAKLQSEREGQEGNVLIAVCDVALCAINSSVAVVKFRRKLVTHYDPLLLFCVFVSCGLSRAQVRVRGFSERPFDTLDTLDTTKSPAENVEPVVPVLEDAEETSGFYQSVIAWKSLQEWAQRAWAKHYQQSPIGSTQNVEPIIVQGLEPLRLGQPQLLFHSPDEQWHREIKSADLNTGKNVLHRGHDNVTKQLSLPSCHSAIQVPKLTVACEAESLATNQSDPRGSGDGYNSFERPALAAAGLSDGRSGDKNKLVGVAPTCHKKLVPVDQSGRNLNRRTTPSTTSSKYSKSRSNTSSEGSSPATSFSESSPKPCRRTLTQLGTLPGSDRPPGLQPPPSYGDMRRELRGNSSNRSSMKSEKSAYSSEENRRFHTSKPVRCFLPHAVVYLTWVVSMILIAGCTVVAIVFGIDFTYQQSVLWVQSVFFSGLQCFFISHPLIVLSMTIYTAIRYRNNMSIFDHHCDGIVCEKSAHSSKSNIALSVGDAKDFSVAKGIAARQRSRYLRFARPPQEQRLIEARHKTMKEANALALINETVLFLFQFALLLVIVYGKSPTTAYSLNHSIKEILIGTHSNRFTNISSVEMWWDWAQNSFIDQMAQESNDSSIKGVANSLLIGQINLRQLRIKSSPCTYYVHSFDNVRCLLFYDDAVGKNFTYRGKNWQNTTYKSAAETGSSSYTSNYGTYGGDGYLVSFQSGINSAVMRKKLRDLEDSNWIDPYTSAVIIEMTLFHTQSTLFGSVLLALELPPMGRVQTSHRINSVYLYKYSSEIDHFVLGCELLFFIAMLVKIHHETLKVIRIGTKYFKNVWNGLEVSQCILSVALVIGLIYRFLFVMETVEKLRSTYFQAFVDVYPVEYWDQLMRCISGFVLLCVGMHLLKSLRHQHPFAKFANIYQHAALDVVILGWMFIIWVGAFSSLGVVMFGSQMRELSSFSSAIGFLTSLGVRIYNFDVSVMSLSSAAAVGWHIFMAVFVLAAFGTMKAYIVAALTFNYKVYKDESVLVFNCRDAFSYYWDRLSELLHIGSPQDRKEPENCLPPEFTMAEIQFQVDEMLSKMNALAGGANLPDKPKMYSSDSDTTYGGPGAGAEDEISSGGSEVRDAYEDERLEDRLQKLRDSLFVNEPHLAELLHLNSIGATVSEQQDREKLLVLQLEMEIFRQLQMRRRDDRPSDSFDVYATSGGSSSSSSSSSAQPKSLTSSNMASMSSPSSLPSSRTSADSRLASGSSASRCEATGRHVGHALNGGSDETRCKPVVLRNCDEVMPTVAVQQAESVQTSHPEHHVSCKPPKVPVLPTSVPDELPPRSNVPPSTRRVSGVPYESPPRSNSPPSTPCLSGVSDVSTSVAIAALLQEMMISTETGCPTNASRLEELIDCVALESLRRRSSASLESDDGAVDETNVSSIL